MSDTEKTKVFISYSRRDSSEFADELVAGLELAGFAPFLDRHDIAAGEDWEARLGGLIAQADTVVFVVSPEAVKSERCVWEVDKALASSKRLLPVIFKPVTDADIPEKLRRLQFVRFDTGRALTRSISELAAALRVDLGWIREHTRLGELAARWQARGRPSSLLLRDDVDAAKSWVARRRAEAPPVTDLQRVFIDASSEAEDLERRRGRRLRRQKLGMWTALGVFALGIAIVLATWRHEQWLKEQIYWLTSVRGHVHTAAMVRALKPQQPFKDCTGCPEMVVVLAGEFVMREPAHENGPFKYEPPPQKVTITQPFAVARFEATFDEWDACAAHGDCDLRVVASRWGRGRQPVINVSWDDARRYVAWLSRITGQPYRLLSEAEWEYAARAGTATLYSFGDDSAALDQYAWYISNSGGRAHPVGEKKPNAFGLYDMHGNVFEWVEDCYEFQRNGAPTDGSARATGGCGSRVLRGGSFNRFPADLRSGTRNGSPPTGFRVGYIGFRVGRTLDR